GVQLRLGTRRSAGAGSLASDRRHRARGTEGTCAPGVRLRTGPRLPAARGHASGRLRRWPGDLNLVHDPLLQDKDGLRRREQDPARPVPPHEVEPVRASLARVRLERLGQGEAVQLLGEGWPWDALAARDIQELLEALV